MYEGVSNVFNLSNAFRDSRFLDAANTWYLYSNEPLKKSLEKFAKFPIATSYQDNEPRLLLVSVDVLEGASVVFDSYEKADGTRKTEYGHYGPEFAGGLNEDGEGHEYVIRYDNGIEVDFVLASGSVPVNYDYTKLSVENYDNRNEIKSEDLKRKDKGNGNGNPNSVATTTTTKMTIRYFWDGGIIANTPLREAVIEHRRYWHYVRKSKVPGLRVCIVNMHPLSQDSLPTDYDGLVDRKNDLIYHDRTLFDERMAIMITDYVNIVNRLIELAEANEVKSAEVYNILKQQALTRNFMTGKHLTYEDLVEYMVSVDLVVRIERKNDVHTISNKTFDFSKPTIRQLIKDGYEEGIEQGT